MNQLVTQTSFTVILLDMFRKNVSFGCLLNQKLMKYACCKFRQFQVCITDSIYDKKY